MGKTTDRGGKVVRDEGVNQAQQGSAVEFKGLESSLVSDGKVELHIHRPVHTNL
jgi:hypothetical protein